MVRHNFSPALRRQTQADLVWFIEFGSRTASVMQRKPVLEKGKEKLKSYMKEYPLINKKHCLTAITMDMIRSSKSPVFLSLVLWLLALIIYYDIIFLIYRLSK